MAVVTFFVIFGLIMFVVFVVRFAFVMLVSVAFVVILFVIVRLVVVFFILVIVVFFAAVACFGGTDLLGPLLWQAINTGNDVSQNDHSDGQDDRFARRRISEIAMHESPCWSEGSKE